MKILDCTLRDGGYYTNWDFEGSVVEKYFRSLEFLPVEYLEIGYRNNPTHEYMGQYYYCPLYVLENARRNTSKKLAIILDEKNVRPADVDKLIKPCTGLIDMIRIAVDPGQMSRALKLASLIKGLGFEVAFNTMYMSKWRQYEAFLGELKFVDEVADYFYMVDSYGGVYPSDVIETIGVVKERTSCRLGFHGHNNLELGLINSLTALEHGVDIIDATVTGMGRGAGNLKTELLLTALNSRDGLEVDFNALGNVVDAFSELQNEYGWGTNLPYMVSGANSLPQKDVMEWVTRRFYSFNSIIRALSNQKNKVEDNRKLPVFIPSGKYRKAFIIGGGPNAVSHAEAVSELIRKNSQSCCIIHASSKNASMYEGLEVDQFFCLVGNEGHRLEQVFNSLHSFSGKCLLPPFPRKMGTYIPDAVVDVAFELPSITFTDRLFDSHTALALQAALTLATEDVLLLGYDGYQNRTITQLERTLSEENEFLFSAFKDSTKMRLVSITPTNYQGVEVTSVYSYLV